jgi:hypothetical protein
MMFMLTDEDIAQQQGLWGNEGVECNRCGSFNPVEGGGDDDGEEEQPR